MYISKVRKVKFSLYLTMYQAMKTYWEWRYSSTYSEPQQQMKESSQLHTPAALPPEKEPSATIW
jgi:hypothetical protein